MKKHKLLLLSSFIFFTIGYGMQEATSLICDYRNTNICLTKCSIDQVDGVADIIVLGANEQKKLDRTVRVSDNTAEVNTIRCNIARIIKPEDDSASDEDKDNPCNFIKHRDHNFYEKKMQSYLLSVVEPSLCNPRPGKKEENYSYPNRNLRGKQALEKASNDLALCYTAVLAEGLRIKIKNKKHDDPYTIALPTLSTALYFPRKLAVEIALESVINFIDQNPGKYDYIYLLVKKSFEFEWYKEWLINHVMLINYADKIFDEYDGYK